MKGKISEMMDHIAPEYLANLDLSAEETAALTADLNLKRVRELAEAKREQEPILSERKTGKKKRMNWKYLIAVAILVLGMGTAVSAHQMGYFELMFGLGAKVPEEQVIKIQESISDQGVIMTLAEILPGDGGGIVVMTFEREDGQAFDEMTRLAEFELMVVNEAGEEEQSPYLSGSDSYLLTEDNHKLICYYKISRGEQIVNQQIKVRAGTLYIPDYPEEAASFTLGEYFQANEAQVMRNITEAEMRARQMAAGLDDEPDWEVINELLADREGLQNWLEDSRKNAWIPELPLAAEQPSLKLAGMLLVDDVLFVTMANETEPPQDNSSLRDMVGIYFLQDSRTEEYISYGLGYGETMVFAGIYEADLPYLVPVVSYDLAEVVAEASWDFTTFVEDRGSVRQAEIEVEVAASEGSYRLTEVTLSPLTINVRGHWLNREENGGMPFDHPEIRILLDDGTWVQMQAAGGYYAAPEQEFELSYMLTQEEEEGMLLRFLDRNITDNLVELRIDGQSGDWF